MQKWFKSVACEIQARHGICDMICYFDGLGTFALLRKTQSMLDLHLEPDLPHIRSTLGPLKEAVLKEGSRLIELPGLRQIQDKFVHQSGRHIREVGVTLDRLHAFVGSPAQNAENLIHPGV